MKKGLSTNFSTRQYMRSKDFEIYYYNDKNLTPVKDHTHNYYEFYFFLNGEVSIWIEDVCYRLKTGDMILIPPHVHHYPDIHSAEEPYQRFIFWISEEYCNDLMALSPDYVYLMQHVKVTHEYVYHYDVIGFNMVQSKIIQLIEELHSDRFGKNVKTSLCVKDLVLHLNRTIYEQQHPNTPKEDQSLYQNLVMYIEDHLDEELSLNQLAGEFFVSKYHIAHIFKENVGLSIHQYILKKRLAMCRDMILSHTEISEAFLLCGFKDYSSFYRSFKKEYGMSPKEYKELHSQ
ncbi:MAG: AraC family transcriptional regulator [Hespellia sp.]|nr:AraC family transcriptional regulator [Hespellia sp.]